MAAPATKIEFWRSFFRDSDHDLWTIIDKAITVAALDFPDKLRSKRDGFAEKLFGGPSQTWEDFEEDESHGLRGSVCRSQAETTTSNEDNLDLEYVMDMGSGNRDEADNDHDHLLVMKKQQVLEIRQVLLDDDKTDEDTLEALHKLAKLQLPIETLKSTSIGKPVNALRKHPSSQIKSMAKKIIRSWKAVADEWAKSSEVVQASEENDEEFGLPAPPMDEGELLAALDMPQLMDFMNNNMASGCSDIDNSPLVQVSYASSRASHSPLGVSAGFKAHETKSSNTGFCERRSSEVHRKERFQQKPVEDVKRTQNLSQKLPVEEYSIKDRLAAAKRKLQEGYQQAETAKKQRTVQVMELEELPKRMGPKVVKRQPATFKPALHNKAGFHRR